MLLKALKSESLQSWHKTSGSPGHLCVIQTNQKGPNPSLMSEKGWEVVEILFSVKEWAKRLDRNLATAGALLWLGWALNCQQHES